jgi:hypothetical protein
MENLKEKIRKEMTADKVSALDRNFGLSKEFFTLAKDGSVSLKVDCSKLSNEEQIELYLVGKLYSKEAEYSIEDSATNRELEKELGLPSGSVKSTLKTLRDSRAIRQVREGVHTISLNRVTDVLTKIKNKLESRGKKTV